MSAAHKKAMVALMSRQIHHNRLLVVALIVTSQTIFTVPILALDNETDLVLEEVIVTAQKREESLQDVPISVSAMSGARVKDLNLRNAQEMADFVPNFAIIQDPIGDKINIRGIQSGNLASFEQSVATYVDGVYRGRGVQARFSFLDPGTIEVLRGPQGTLFGKNTIGGALNIRSARPTDELSAELTTGYNVDFEDTTIDGFVAGPISDALRARVAFKKRDQKKGWVHNTSYDSDMSEIQETAGRLIVEWDSRDNTFLSVKIEAGDWDIIGQPWDHITVASVPGLVGNKDYSTSMGNRSDYAQTVLGYTESQIGNTGPIDFGSNNRFTGDSREAVIRAEYDLQSGSMITAIVAFSAYDFKRQLDADYNPLPGIRYDDSEDFEQRSIELRIRSGIGGSLEYLGGLYYQRDELEIDGLGIFNGTFLHAYLGQTCIDGGGTAVGSDIDTLAANFGNTSSEIALNCANTAQLAPLALLGIEGANRYLYLNQNTDSWAAFAQLTWILRDDLRLTGGLRYTYEEKEAQQGANAADYGAGITAPSTDPLIRFAAYGIGEFTRHDYDFDDLNRKDDVLTWSANLQWDINEDVMGYVSASSGFKGGGYSSFYLGEPNNVGASPDDVDFEREKALAFELGAKTSLLEGRAELNFAAFYTKYDNLQVAIFTGASSFIVQNAAEATTQGIELDARLRVAEDLTLSANFAWLDFVYDDFANQACTSEQFVAARDLEFAKEASAYDLGNLGGAALYYTNQDCGSEGINNLAGKTSENSPEYQASLIAEHTLTLGNYSLHSLLGVSYQDAQFRQADLDPILEEDAFIKVDLSLKLSSVAGNWDLSLIGRNLGDVTTISYGNDTPLFTGMRQIALDAPRNLTVRGTLRF